MKTQVDNVPKNQRAYFKEGVLKAINGNGKVHFTLDKAIIETDEPYFIDNEALSAKSNSKKAINQFLADYRIFQFNNSPDILTKIKYALKPII